MPNILFKSDISHNVLYDFLNIFCRVENDYYIIDKLIYKKYEYNNYIQTFFDKIKHYYKPSKMFYTTREINYYNLLTVIRQICKNNNIPYSSKIKYDKNKYYIIYYIKKI